MCSKKFYREFALMAVFRQNICISVRDKEYTPYKPVRMHTKGRGLLSLLLNLN